MTSRKIALGLARQFRTCPPADIRGLPEYREQVLRHQQICPYCSQGEDFWEKLLVGCRRSMEDGAVPAEPVSAGQIREIRPGLGRWKDGFYINPPMVLVLVSGRESASVAQVYHDATLAGPGDVILPEVTGFAHGIFVELLNVFEIRMQMLGVCATRIPSPVFEDLRQIQACGEKPSWYILPRPITENDPRIFFRAVEKDVSRLFALTVRRPLAERLGEMMTELKQITVSGILDIIAGAVPDARWPRAPQGDAVSFSDDPSLSSAAVAWLLSFVSGQLTDVEPLSAGILQSEIIDGLLAIGGRIHPFPEGVLESDVYVYLQSANDYIDAREIHLDLSSGAFLAKFRGPFLQKGTLLILILRPLNGRDDMA